MRTAPFAQGFFVGDYEGLGHTRGAFVPFFVMTNSGNLSNRTDVFAAAGEGDNNVDINVSDSAVESNATSARSAQDLVTSHRRNAGAAR
jgi:hypothetical protein